MDKLENNDVMRLLDAIDALKAAMQEANVIKLTQCADAVIDASDGLSEQFKWEVGD